MFTLIKREIQDNIPYFLLAIILAVVAVTSVVWWVAFISSHQPPIGIPMSMYIIFLFLIIPLSFFSAVLGAAQMYADRDKKMSAFLSTLATTRRQILTARILTGVLWILLVLLPIAAADAVLLQVFPRLVPTDTSFLVKIFATAFLTSLACYSLGLQTSWSATKFIGIAITPVLISVIIIKGIGIETLIILLLFLTASMTRTWQRFTSNPL